MNRVQAIDAPFAQPLGSRRMRIADSRQRRLAAVMFTDMVGYSVRMRADEARALRLLEQHFRLVRSILPVYRGREIKTIGDAFLLSFDSVRASLDCGVAVQQAHAARNLAVPEAERFEIRIGIHLGDIERRGNDVFGDGVNVASRLQALAPPGGLAVSVHVHAQVHGELAQRFRALGPQALKNIEPPMEVFLLDAAALPAPAATTGVRRPDGVFPAMAAAAAVAIGATAFYWLQPRPLPMPAAEAATTTATLDAKVSLLEASAIALKDAGAGAPYHVELEGRSYSVDIARGAQSVNLVIDADDGNVMEKLVEDEDHSEEIRMSRIGLDQAVEAALEKTPGVAVEAEIRLLPGRAVIEVKLLHEGRPLLVEVDGASGQAALVTLVRQ